MGLMGELRMYARFAWGLRGFVHGTMTQEKAKALVEERLAQREASFLRLLEKGVFGYSRSPYLPLFNVAQANYGDVEKMVRDKGLDDTLRALRRAGIYVSFEEFKGREPLVRDGTVIPVKATDFDNPYLRRYYHVESGGSTGRGTRVPLDLDQLAAQAPQWMLAYEAHGLPADIPTIMWRGVLPDGSALNGILRGAHLGNVPRKWFTPVTSRDLRPSFKYRLANQAIIVLGRLYGARIPWPEPVPLDQASVVARHVTQTIQSHGACLVRCHVSLALRVCVAAEGAGLDLSGATFMGAGEPPTPAKVGAITRTGARYIPTYHFTELGAVGIGCPRPMDANDIHLYRDSAALIQYPHEVPGSGGLSVDAFCFTSLLPTASKIMLNVESDDYGIVETRPCGCLLETLGFTQHVREIRSFRKLSGEGMTLVGSEMMRILDEVLPARFGGSPLDYQLLEEEDEQGFTRLSLIVSPRIEIEDEGAVVQTVLDALSESSAAADIARATWGQARTLRVKRMEPIWASRGRLRPLHLGTKGGK